MATIDHIVSFLSHSIFHPFPAALLTLCLRAVGYEYSSPRMVISICYAIAITTLYFLQIVSNRIAYDRPREVDWDEEVVVITGGASGLGRVLAETYGMRGASVAVLDVSPKPKDAGEGLESVELYGCDVGDAEAVERCREAIEKDLGTPTILINNAATPVHGKPLHLLTAQEVNKTLSVNLVAHFNTLRTFLPGMLASETGGHIVTIASVLGKLGASHLSDYTASKAALIAMHRSLVAELASSDDGGAANVRTILVTPGQLSTPMFKGVETPSSFFGPVVEPVELASQIVRMIDAGMSGEIALPLYARLIDWMFVLPPALQRVARWASGMDGAFEKYVKKRDGVRDGEKKGPNDRKV